jgi:hypothetical protein
VCSVGLPLAEVDLGATAPLNPQTHTYSIRKHGQYFKICHGRLLLNQWRRHLWTTWFSVGPNPIFENSIFSTKWDPIQMRQVLNCPYSIRGNKWGKERFYLLIFQTKTLILLGQDASVM